MAQMVLILTTSFYCKCEFRKVLTPELYNVPMLPNVHFLNGKKLWLGVYGNLS